MGTFLTATTQKPIVMFLWYVWQFSVIQIFSSAKHSTDYVGQYEYQTNMFDQQYLRVVHWWRLSWGQLRGEYQVLEGDTSQSNYLQKCKFFKVFNSKIYILCNLCSTPALNENQDLKNLLKEDVSCLKKLYLPNSFS